MIKFKGLLTIKTHVGFHLVGVSSDFNREAGKGLWVKIPKLTTNHNWREY